MIDVIIRADKLIPSGRACLTRHGMVASVGTVAQVMEHYRSGDVVVVAEDVWEGLQAQFAQDVTPSPDPRSIAEGEARG